MNIDDLLDKYFEGETSADEERRIRTFFASGKTPRRLDVYKPMFAYFDEEIRKKRAKSKPPTKRRILYGMLAAAASLVLLLGIKRFLFVPDPCFCSESYVVINGRCYTDIQKVKELAFVALQEVATPAKTYFPEEDTDAPDRKLIENQLKELSSIFSNDE
ncbi:MAG: hypothetical protein LBJ60_07080 [Tannerellaceae bacterium]|jgi:hypothetical protein|nr:hypothetical protein [Tannerellaceae bacterium]